MAGLINLYTHTKNNPPTNQKGYDKHRDHRWKALVKENSNQPCIILCDPFFFQNNFPNDVRAKIYTAYLD